MKQLYYIVLHCWTSSLEILEVGNLWSQRQDLLVRSYWAVMQLILWRLS